MVATSLMDLAHYVQTGLMSVLVVDANLPQEAHMFHGVARPS